MRYDTMVSASSMRMFVYHLILYLIYAFTLMLVSISSFAPSHSL
jgi:hypothetical protein